jgi:hypothetical protein
VARVIVYHGDKRSTVFAIFPRRGLDSSEFTDKDNQYDYYLPARGNSFLEDLVAPLNNTEKARPRKLKSRSVPDANIVDSVIIG